jgi:farnesyl diphosphate synthase
LTYAFDIMADPRTHQDGNIRSALVLGLARAAGLGGMVGGQALDLAAEKSEAPLSAAEIACLQAMKTGALLLYAVEAGALIGAASPRAKAALTRFGTALGAAFQIADDILDATSTDAELGKRAGKDADRNKATLVALFGLERACKRRDDLAQEAEAALDELGMGANVAILREAARFTVARRN